MALLPLKQTLSCIFIFVCFSVYSQNSIAYHPEKIVVDGKLDEPVWNELSEITGFYNYRPNDEGVADNQTIVKIFHDAQYLYIGAIYHDTSSNIQTNSLKRDMLGDISDAFFIILDTQNQKQNGYYFAVNGYGTQNDGLVERSDNGYTINASWNTVWKTMTSVEGTNKIYELAIPLKALSYNNNSSAFGIQFYVNDIKKNSVTVLSNVKRNFPLFDLRFTSPFTINKLPKESNSRFAITPSITASHIDYSVDSINRTEVIPSLDLQYNISSSLKLDATFNPDFSQIDVDQQVTNLTRFAVFFPERRNFFLENSDLFSNLGVAEVNPFYSRRIGAQRDILFGLKLSGNVSSKTRIGILNAQTKEQGDLDPQNYGALVTEYKLNGNLLATGYIINRQQTESFGLIKDYNRVSGINLNYQSNNNNWLAQANYSKSFNNNLDGDNSFYNAALWYNSRGFQWNLGIKDVGENYITEVGFNPRLYNYDAISGETNRERYTHGSGGIYYEKFYEQSKVINSIRYAKYENDTYFDEEGELSQISHFFNTAIFFSNFSAFYANFSYDYIDLKYPFDPLGNGKVLKPSVYKFPLFQIGYNSANNQKLRYRLKVFKGQYYDGRRMAGGAYLNYQVLPFANFELSYDVNHLDLNELGDKTFHLSSLASSIFFSTRLNWTTYIQYNTQQDNLNLNTRLQWEYKPLSYIYFVISDNYDQYLQRSNWGAALKINYRLDI